VHKLVIARANGTRGDFDDKLKQDFGLVEVPGKDFDEEAGIA
jgi:hypothetical protein